jgi:transposase
MDTNTKAVAQRYGRGPYKRHPVAFKRAVVEASLAPGASVSRVAREHDINANQVFLWRRLYRDGLLNAVEPALLPVSFEQPAHAVERVGSRPVTGTLVIEYGALTVRIEGRPDGETLLRVLAELRRS